MTSASLERILRKYDGSPHNLLQILREVQEEAGWISPASIAALEEALGVPRAKIVGAASFYAFLYLEPVGRYRILFSDNITDRSARRRNG